MEDINHVAEGAKGKIGVNLMVRKAIKETIGIDGKS